MSAPLFKYTRAIVCGIPRSLPEAALRQDEHAPPIDLKLAREQHERYVNALEKDMGLQVIRMKENESFPDCVFVEDPVVVCGDTAMLTIPGHISRRGETLAIKRELDTLGVKVVQMKKPGLMDGGDVLFTGREFFVGVSSRTNEEGASQLSQFFPSYPVTCIPVSGTLHLKSFCSMASPNVIAIGSSEAAQQAMTLMKEKARFPYQYILTSSDVEANCVYANNVLIHLTNKERQNPFCKLDCQRVSLPLPELYKVDGCFTCCSVLIP